MIIQLTNSRSVLNIYSGHCHVLSNNHICQYTDAQYVLLFLVLAVNSDQFRILRSYMLLLHPLVLVRSCPEPRKHGTKLLGMA